MTSPSVTTGDRKEAVLNLARDYVLSEATGPAYVAVVADAQRLGLDLLRDPAQMAAVSVLGECWRFNYEPSPRALAILGVTG